MKEIVQALGKHHTYYINYFSHKYLFYMHTLGIISFTIQPGPRAQIPFRLNYFISGLCPAQPVGCPARQPYHYNTDNDNKNSSILYP